MRGIMLGYVFRGLENLILIFNPHLSPEHQILVQKGQLQVKMLKDKSPSISESTKPTDLNLT